MIKDFFHEQYCLLRKERLSYISKWGIWQSFFNHSGYFLCLNTLIIFFKLHLRALVLQRYLEIIFLGCVDRRREKNSDCQVAMPRGGLKWRLCSWGFHLHHGNIIGLFFCNIWESLRFTVPYCRCWTKQLFHWKVNIFNGRRCTWSEWWHFVKILAQILAIRECSRNVIHVLYSRMH